MSKCEQRVATREDTRLMWDATFSYLDPDGVDETVDDLRMLLDQTYPTITVADCLNGTA